MSFNSTAAGFLDIRINSSRMLMGDQLSASNSSVILNVSYIYPWAVISAINQATVVVNCLMSLLVLFANLLVFISFARFEYVRTRENTTLLNLSFSDLLTVPGVIMASILLVLPESPLSHEKYPCLVAAYLLALSYIGQIWSTVLITLERWMSVFYPLRHHVIITSRKLHVLLTMMWAVIVAVVSASMWAHRWEPGARCFPLRLVDPYMALILGMPSIAMPFFIMPVLYGLLYRQSLRQQNQIRQQMQSSSGSTQMGQLDSHKPTRTLGLILGVFYSTWIPTLLASYVVSIHTQSSVAIIAQKLFMDVATMILFASSYLNPLIYHRSSPTFRQAFTMLLCRGRLRERRRQHVIQYLKQEKSVKGFVNPAMDRETADVLPS